MTDVEHQLCERRKAVIPSVHLDVHKTSLTKQMPNTRRCVSIVVVWPLVELPHERYGEGKTAICLKHAKALAQHLAGISEVLEHLRAKDEPYTGGSKRQSPSRSY